MRLWYRPGPLRGVVQILVLSSVKSQNTACALRFLNKIRLFYNPPRMLWIGTFRRVPWATATSKFQVLPAAAHHEHCSQPLWRCLRSCWWPVQSHSPLVLTLRNPLLPWLPVSLRHILQRVKRGVSPSWPVRHNLLVRPLKTFHPSKELQEKKQPLHSPWLLLLEVIASAVPEKATVTTPSTETGWHDEDPGIWWRPAQPPALLSLASGLQQYLCMIIKPFMGRIMW